MNLIGLPAADGNVDVISTLLPADPTALATALYDSTKFFKPPLVTALHGASLLVSVLDP